MAPYHKTLQLSLSHKVLAIKLKPNVLLLQKLLPVKMSINVCPKTAGKVNACIPLPTDLQTSR